MNYDIITIGGATEDITFFTDEGIIIDNKKDLLHQKLLAFEYGSKIRTTQTFSSWGGGANNVAVGLARLGLKVSSLMAIGDDARGLEIVKNLAYNKVDTNLIQMVRNTQTGFSFLVVGKGNEHVAFLERGANSELSIRPNKFKIIKEASWLYITSLSGEWEKLLDKIFSINNQNKSDKSTVKIAWNPGSIQLQAGAKKLKKYLAKTEVLALNKDEALELVISSSEYKNKDDKYLNNIKNLAKAIKKWGPKIVLITNNRQGADCFDGENFFHQDILNKEKPKDTTGVGDAFNSTFTAGLIFYKGDIPKALHLAAKNAASVIRKPGAQNGLITQHISHNM